MRFFAPALLLVPLMSSASPNFDTFKTLDGAVQYCNSADDVGAVGAKLENTLVDQATNDVQFSFNPNYYRCAKTAKGYEWQTSTVTEFLSRDVKTEEGMVKIVPTSYQWVVYSQSYTELHPMPNVKAGGSLKYSVSVSDLLGEDQKGRYEKGLASRGIITVFMKYVTKAVYPNGKELNLGLHATGSFNIVIDLPAN